jgi:hypothetical protein
MSFSARWTRFRIPLALLPVEASEVRFPGGFALALEGPDPTDPMDGAIYARKGDPSAIILTRTGSYADTVASLWYPQETRS